MPLDKRIHVAAVCAALAATSCAASAAELAPGPRGPAPEGWRASNWDAGQSRLVRWSPQNLRWTEDSVLEFVLDAGDGQGRPLRGAEIQSRTTAREGVWRWRAQAPRMVEGAIFGLFLYQADHANDPWMEYDFEFVGADTTVVQLNIHFENDAGRHVALDQKLGRPVLVELSFDAADAMHDYEIEVADETAVFRVDGEEVGRFGPGDMPGGTWREGPMRSFVDLWAVDSGLSDWAGTWRHPGRPLIGRIEALGLPGDGGEAARAE